MIYYLSIILLSAFSLLNQINIRKSDLKLVGLFSVLFLIVLGGLRYEVGADWEPYKNLFIYTKSWNDVFQARPEPFYMLSGYIIKMIFSDYSLFILIFFTIAFLIKFYIIRLYSPDIFLSLIVYFYTIFLIYDVNGLRQGMAMGITLLSIPAILNREVKKFIFLVVVASLFHISALIFMPFYFLARLKIRNIKLLLILLIILVLAYPVRTFILKNSISELLLGSKSLSHYASYFNNKIYQTDIPILSIALFQRLFIFFIFLIQYDKIQDNDELKLLLRNGYFIAITLFLILSFSAEFGSRLGFYYKGLEMIMIPMIVSSSSRLSNRLILLLLFLIFCLYGAYRLLSIPNGYLLPYKNILF